nr:glutamate receptor 2.1-like [Ziziphus jujuba var. spinosa]
MDTQKMLFVIIFFGIGVCTVNAVENGSMESKPQVVGVGVILNLASPVGQMAEGYISMAVSDFYAIHANYRTRLALSVKDSVGDVVEAASAALELINDEQVQAIIRPQTSTEAKFVIDLGDRAQIPIISFSATSPSLSPTQNPFFIRTAQDDCSQVKALTSIVETYGWKEVVLIYEDIEYGNGLIPYLTDALQVSNIRVPHRSIITPNSSKFEILKQLNMIMARQTRILLVHVSASLGSKLFRLAKQIGMMSEGYAWIITKGLSLLLDPLRKKVFGSMHGVVGVRPYLPNAKRLQDFKTRWNKTSGDINLFGLWALAMAAESLNPTALVSHNSSINSIEPFGLRVSESGPQLLQKLLNIKFEGLSGEFNLIRGQLKPTDYEIINVRGKLGERVIGNWSLENGIPHGIGIPIAPAGFEEFLKIEWDPHTDEPSFSGFSYDIFLASLDKLPFALPHKFIPFANSFRQNNGTYDELLYQIKLKKFDAIVGDTTIVAHRTKYVDFTLP